MSDDTTIAALIEEVAALRDLFQRRLLDDRAKTRLYDELAAQTRFAQDGLVRGHLRPLYGELLLIVDRLRRERDDVSASIVVELEEILERRGVRRVAVGPTFDPAVHHAVGTEPSRSVPRGGVLAVVRDGYLLEADVLRPASVVVSAGGRQDGDAGGPLDRSSDD